MFMIFASLMLVISAIISRPLFPFYSFSLALIIPYVTFIIWITLIMLSTMVTEDERGDGDILRSAFIVSSVIFSFIAMMVYSFVLSFKYWSAVDEELGTCAIIFVAYIVAISLADVFSQKVSRRVWFMS